MSHQSITDYKESLLEMDYTGITTEYMQGRINMHDYDYLINRIQKSCSHRKSKIVMEWIGGRGYVPTKICQECFYRSNVTL